MSFLPYTVVALAKSDADGTSGSNIVAGAVVTIKLGGVTATMYDDSAGANPSTSKVTGSNGQIVIWIAKGVYELTINGSVSSFSIADPSSTAVTPVTTVTNTIGIIAGKMWAGETIKIACFGDSTTDGNQTALWSANPTDGSGNAVGNSDHNLTAVNAWPTKIETLLRDAFRNTNISTFNAGYSGKRMDDGWANANYQAAVIDNPFYGIPDITFIGFGLNDIQSGPSSIDDFITQSRILMIRILADGTVPVLLTCDASFRGASNARSHVEARREIDSAKKSLALEFGVPLLDVGLELKGWIQNNTDGFRWSQEQTDGLHFENNGHAFKSQFIATLFMNDLVNFSGGSQTIDTWSSQSEYVGNYATRYERTNNSQGGNILYSSGAPASTDMVTMWVWSNCPNAYLIYQGMDNEWATSGDFTIKPKVTVKEWFSGTSDAKDIISAGDELPVSGYRRSDEQFIHSKLKYGLNKVVYTSGNCDSLFYGSFKISEGDEKLSSNALKESGLFTKHYPASSGVYFDLVSKADRLANTAGGFVDDIVSLSFDVNCPRQGGLIALHGQGFSTSQASVDNNQQNAILIFRTAIDRIAVYNLSYELIGGASAFSLITETAAGVWTTDNLVGRIEIRRAGSNQGLIVYDALVGGSSVINTFYGGTGTLRWSGYAGGLFYNSDTAAVPATLSINTLLINR